MIKRCLQVEDLDSVLDLFTRMFGSDPYYKKLAGRSSVDELIKVEFSKEFEGIIRAGASYGLFENNRMIGFLLGFITKDLEMINKPIYDSIFYKANNLRSVIESITQDTYFIVSYVVEEDYTNKGLEEELIRYMMDNVGHMVTYITDVYGEDTVKKLQPLGFQIKVVNGLTLQYKSYGRVW